MAGQNPSAPTGGAAQTGVEWAAPALSGADGGPAVGGSQRYAVPRRATAARVRASCVCDVAPGGHAPSRYGTNLSVLFLVAEYFQVTLLRSCPGCYGDET